VFTSAAAENSKTSNRDPMRRRNVAVLRRQVKEAGFGSPREGPATKSRGGSKNKKNIKLKTVVLAKKDLFLAEAGVDLNQGVIKSRKRGNNTTGGIMNDIWG